MNEGEVTPLHVTVTAGTENVGSSVSDQYRTTGPILVDDLAVKLTYDPNGFHADDERHQTLSVRIARMNDDRAADMLALVVLMTTSFLFGAMVVGIAWWLT